MPVTELDHAWFVDRATHMSISESKLRDALTLLKTQSADWPPTPAKIRQFVYLNVRPSNQRKDRLGRDIAYYVTGVGKAALVSEEAIAWKDREKRNAVDVGLSDERTMPAYALTTSISHPMPTGVLSASEARVCPSAVLNPKKP